MNGISGLIEKIAKKLQINKVDYDLISIIISNTIGFSIKKEQIILKGVKIICSVSSNVKQEIKIKQKEIILNLKNQIPNIKIDVVE